MKSFYSITIRPDKSFTIGVIPQLAHSHSPKTQLYDRDFSIEQALSGVECGLIGVGDEVLAIKLDGVIREFSLNLTNVANSHNPVRARVRRGLRGVTRRQKRGLRSGCALLDELRRGYELALLTVTLPPLPDEGLSRVAASWSQLQHRFTTKLRVALQGAGCPDYLLGCVELQSKRLEKHGQLAYHFHFAYPCRERGQEYYLSVDAIRQLWSECVCSIAEVSNAPNLFNSAVNLQKIRKSIAGYLSKYLSKGEEVVERVVEQFGERYVPHTWIYLCKHLRERIKARTLKRRGSIASFVWDLLHDEPHLWTDYLRPVLRETPDGYKYLVGFSGVVTHKLFLLVKGFPIQIPDGCDIISSIDRRVRDDSAPPHEKK